MNDLSKPTKEEIDQPAQFFGAVIAEWDPEDMAKARVEQAQEPKDGSMPTQKQGGE